MTKDEIKFIKEQIEEARALATLGPEGRIAALCEQHGCSKEKTAHHTRQYVKGNWNPHPSERFRRWWLEQGGWQETERVTSKHWSSAGKAKDERIPLNYVSAYNCADVQEVYREFRREQKERMEADAIEF